MDNISITLHLNNNFYERMSFIGQLCYMRDNKIILYKITKTQYII